MFTDYVDRTVDSAQNAHKYAHGVDNFKRLNITLAIHVVSYQIMSRFLIDSADDRQ